jgi:hypothetical protein
VRYRQGSEEHSTEEIVKQAGVLEGESRGELTDILAALDGA